MKWIVRLLAGLCLSIVVVFQNCSPSHNPSGSSSLSSFDISQVYPYYLEKPVYFNDVQLTGVVQNNSVWEYQFIASAVDIDTPANNIDVNIQIRDQKEKLLCVSKTVRINSKNNIIQLDDCKSSQKATEARIKVFIKPATKSAYDAKPTSTYTFKLNF